MRQRGTLMTATACRRLPGPPMSWGAVPSSLGTSHAMSHTRTLPSLCPVSSTGCACTQKVAYLACAKPTCPTPASIMLGHFCLASDMAYSEWL